MRALWRRFKNGYLNLNLQTKFTIALISIVVIPACLTCLLYTSSAGSKCYLSDTTEDDLCCQCYDHWRQLLETGKDKSVNRTTEGTNNQCCKYYYNERSVCVADHTA